MSKIKVLFICVHNSARSQMAEGFLRKYGVDKFEAFSAGFSATEINPLTIKVMDEIGISLENQYAKNIERYIGEHFGYVITVCHDSEGLCPNFPGITIREDWSLEDPGRVESSEEIKLEAFRKTRGLIEKKVKELIEREA